MPLSLAKLYIKAKHFSSRLKSWARYLLNHHQLHQGLKFQIARQRRKIFGNFQQWVLVWCESWASKELIRGGITTIQWLNHQKLRQKSATPLWVTCLHLQDSKLQWRWWLGRPRFGWRWSLWTRTCWRSAARGARMTSCYGGEREKEIEREGEHNRDKKSE